MSNTKISALTSATTPLAGTETLPIVQSGATTKVTVANLTAGRSVSVGNLTATTAATTALGSANINATDPTLRMKVSGGTADKNTYEFRAIAAGAPYDYLQLRKINDAQTVFTELLQITTDGNISPSIAAKGINFTANTPAAGKTSTLLNWYEEGTWTPTASTWTIAPVFDIATYTRIGRQVTINIVAHSGTCVAGSTIAGLPFASSASAGASVLANSDGNALGFTGAIFNSSSSITNISAATFGGSRYWALSATYFT